jgi:beta-lactam-binding protein with PASTA domain
VDLEPGVNVIDVLASAGPARPALTAVRVRRLIQVAVPDVAGLSVADATKQLEDRGLKADVQTAGGGFFDDLLGAKPKVCQTTPSAGEQVDPGASILVTAAPRC